MNRTIMMESTPARARLLLLMRTHTDFAMEHATFQSITEMAKLDAISDRQFQDHGITNRDDQAAIQFIHDTNFRAGIPVNTRGRERASIVIETAIKIAQIDPKDIIRIKGSNYATDDDCDFIDRLDFDLIARHRSKLLVMDMDNLDPSIGELVGKMFPRIVLSGSMTIQYSFSFGSSDETTSRMGKILHPSLEESIKRSPWKKNQYRSVLAMGVFPGLLEPIVNKNIAIGSNFLVPRNIEY